MLVFSWATGMAMYSILEARLTTEEERKVSTAELCGMPDSHKDLEEIGPTARMVMARPSMKMSFNGGSNINWEISQDEADKIIAESEQLWLAKLNAYKQYLTPTSPVLVTDTDETDDWGEDSEDNVDYWLKRDK